MTPPTYFAPVPSPAGESTSALRKLVAWLVILASAATMFGLTWRSYRQPAGAAAKDSDVRQMQILIASRYAVGAHHLIAVLGQKNANTQKLIDELDGVAKTPYERAQIAIAAGEIQDAAAATRRLDSIDTTASPKLKQGVDALQRIYSGKLNELSPQQRAELIERYGWFGHLALAYKQPPDNPDRQIVEPSAYRTVAVGVGGVIGFGVLFLAGLVLLITAIVMLAQGSIRRAYQPLAAPSQPFLETFAIYIGGFIGIGLLARFVVPAIRTHMPLYYAALLVPPALGVIWPSLCGVPRQAWRQAIGWHTGRGVLREIGCGLVGYIAGLPLMALAFFLVMKLSRFAGANPTHPIIHELGGSNSQVISILILAAVYAPIVEETMFRGALFHALRVRHGWLLSASIVAFLFAAIHPQGWTVIPGLFTIAMIFAAIREWRGTILSSAAAHALNNGTVVLFVVLLMR
jgi:membrane protease YdiL (CAAX protease family)